MNKNNLKKLRFIWGGWLILLILSAFYVPYQILSGIKSVKGAFLYWTFFALFAIITTIKITTYWKED